MSSSLHREIVYYRTYSGEKLTRKQLKRALIRGVKRSLGESGLLKPKAALGVLVPDVNPLGGLVLLDAISVVERSYGGSVVPIINSNIEYNYNINEFNKIFFYNIEKINFNDIIHCWREERAAGLRIASREALDALIIPLTRTDSNLIMIESMLRGEPEALSEALPTLPHTHPPVISGLSKLEGEIVAAYAAVFKLYAWRGQCRSRLRDARELYYSIAVGRPELEFSSHKTLQLFSRGTLRYGVCKRCGGFTRQGELCRYCSG